jgi:hypothetical protein
VCLRSTAVARRACASPWRLLDGDRRGTGRGAWLRPSASHCGRRTMACGASHTPGEHHPALQRLRASRPTPALTEAANGIGAPIRPWLRGLRSNALLGDAHDQHRANALMPRACNHCNRTALLPSASLPVPATHHLRLALASRPLAPCLALVGPVSLVSAAAMAELARPPFADCNCPRRQRLAS